MTTAVRQPVQQRAKETRQRILSGAAKVIGAAGYDGATTHAIAEAAGVSVGSLYAYFKDKEAVIAELFDGHAVELIEIVTAPFTYLDAEDFDAQAAIRQAIDAAVRCHEHDPPLHRAFAAMEHHPALEDRWKAWEAKGLLALGGLLGMVSEGLRVTDVDTAAFVIYHAVMGSCHRCMLYGEGPQQSALIAELADMLTRYLLADVG